MPFWRLFYHVVWATKERQPLINERADAVIRRTIATACEKDGLILHAVGTMPDHVHVAVSIPPTKSIPEIVARWKGASSHLLNHAEQLDEQTHFAWQAEYGIVSFSERNLADVMAYVNGQPNRHARRGPDWDLLEQAGTRTISAGALRSEDVE